jgi:cytochrome c-type biogenesis protein CcmH
MTTFWLAAAGFAGGAVILLLWPLWRSGAEIRVSTLITVAIVPVVAIALYLGTGRPGPAEWNAERPAESSPEDMIAALAERMTREPDRVEGWELLGRSYFALGRYAEAADAYEQAWQRTPNPGSDLKLAFAEAQLLSRKDSVTGLAGQLIEQVLQAEPASPRALLYGGLAAAIRGNLEQARERWNKLLASGPPEPLASAVRERLAELGGEPTSPAPGPTADTAIQVALKLGPDVDPGAVRTASALYVLARAPEGGPPVAVVRRSPDVIPGVVTLSDADGMLRGGSMRDFASLTIVARLSKSGQPAAQPGDVYGEATIAPSSRASIDLTLDRITE